MEIWMDTFTNVICEAARLYLIVRYYNIFFEKEKNVLKKWIVLICVYAFTVGAYLLFHNPWINLVVTYAGLLAITFLYNAKIGKRILFSVLLMALVFILDIISGFIVTENPYSFNHAVAIAYVSILLFLISIIVLEKFHVKGKEELGDKHWIYLMLISAVSICCMMILVGDNSISQISMISIAVVFTVINFAIYYLYNAMNERYISILENRNLKEQINAYESLIRTNVENDKEIRIIRHDLKHHLRELQSLADNNEYSELKNYIVQMISTIDMAKNYVNSGNAALDGVLNYMCAEAAEKKIKIDTRVTLPEDIHLDAYDFNVLLGNLLENAIEATVKTKNPYIRINISYARGCMFIVVKNSCTGEVEQKNGRLISKKGKGHGIGYLSIKKVVLKYEGTITITDNEDEFEVNIGLFV